MINKTFNITAYGKLCPEDPPIWPIISCIVGLIVLIGILAIIAWLIYTRVQEQREFAKFEESQRSSKWNRVRLILSNAFFLMFFIWND